MAASKILVFCAQVLLSQCISSQCIGSTYNNLAWEAGARWGGSSAAPWNAYADTPLAVSWATAPCATTPFVTAEWATSYGPAGLAASNGGNFPIDSVSHIAPTGVSMTSENAYEGPLAVSGTVPFLGAIALEGVLPTAGAGRVTYGCGNENIAILSEDIASAYGYEAGIAATDFGYGYPGLGYEPGLAGPLSYGYNSGCGYRALY